MICFRAKRNLQESGRCSATEASIGIQRAHPKADYLESCSEGYLVPLQARKRKRPRAKRNEKCKVSVVQTIESLKKIIDQIHIQNRSSLQNHFLRFPSFLSQIQVFLRKKHIAQMGHSQPHKSPQPAAKNS